MCLFTLTLQHTHTSDTRCAGLPPPHNPAAPAGSPSIQLHSDAIYQEVASSPQVTGSALQGCPPAQVPTASSRSQLTPCVCLVWLKVRGSFPPGISLFARTAHRTQGNTYVSQLLKDMIKDEPGEEVRRGDVGPPSAGVSVPVTFQQVHVFSNQEASEPRTLGFSWGFIT